MASEEHVDSDLESKDAILNKHKLKKTVLDNFSKITNTNLNVRVKSGASLLKYLSEIDDTEQSDNELKYTLSRVVRGLGASTNNARTGFYSTLVALINSNELDVDDIFEHVTKQLHKAGGNSKGENADISTGQILACGAIIRSNLFQRCSTEEQQKVLETLLNAAKERTYLSLIAYMFIVNSFDVLDEKCIQKTVFPMFKDVISKSWTDHNLDSLYLLISTRNKYANLINKNFLNQSLGTSKIISSEKLSELANALMTVLRVTAIKHPIYELIAQELAPSNQLVAFINELDSHLQRPNRNKHLLFIEILTRILSNLTNFSQLSQLITKNFIQQTLAYLKTFNRQKDADFLQAMYTLFDTLSNLTATKEVPSSEKIEILKKFLIYPGTFIFEKITKSKIVQKLTTSLDADGVKLLGELYKGVVLGEEKIDSKENWVNNDRLYAAHLLVKLLNHPSMSNDNNWRTEQLTFLLKLGLFKRDNVGIELAASLKEAFFNALDMKLTNLENLQIVLFKLAENLQEEIESGATLRNELSEELAATWTQTLEIATKISKKKKNSLKSIFQTLFLHMGLQLFSDGKLASDSLQELFSCYERVRKDKKNEDDSSNDPLWIEVVVDLFLNLLSHNSHLLRSIIKIVFPHLCQYLNEAAVHQILAVLDPKSEANPLSKDGDSSDEDEESGESGSEEDEEDSESEEEIIENVSDKLRLALQTALMKNGDQEDEDSDLDLDEMSETEGEKLNEALADAFKQFKPNKGKSKKQSKDQETLTHFRVRVLDLIEIYLDSNPSMLLALEIMLPLLQAVEFSIRDEHQRPLLHRLKSCLKKLSKLKEFQSSSGVTDTILSELLQSLLEKGTKNAIIVQDMGEQIADCCIFVVRCSMQLKSAESTPKKTKKKLKIIGDIFVNELNVFFNKRDCLTPYVLFKSLLNLNWDGNLGLIANLLGFVFSDDIKPFKRNQALELLKLFYANSRYLVSDAAKINEALQSEHEKFSEQIKIFFTNLCEVDTKSTVKERFVSNLFNLLTTIKNSALEQSSFDWKAIAEIVREYRSLVSFSRDAKLAFNKLCNSLGVSNVVAMKNHGSIGKIEEVAGANVEKKKKNKKQKRGNKDALKLKKETKALRMQSLSEGFGGNVAFKGEEDMNGMEADEPELEKKRKNSVNGDVHEEPKKKKKLKK